MVERIYDALKGILWLQFPKNCDGSPVIYDRVVKNWYMGDRANTPDNITIAIHAQTASEKDYSYGYRQIDYSIQVLLYVLGDNIETTIREAAEGCRLIRNILTQHKRMWVMDLCPICGKLPTSPEHFFVDAEHQAVFGLYGTNSGPIGEAGSVYNSFLSNWNETHYSLQAPGQIDAVNLLTTGSGYTAPPAIVFSGGGIGSSGAAATASIYSGSVNSILMTNYGTQYTATPTVTLVGGTAGITGSAAAVLVAPSTAGIAAAAFYQVYNNIKNTGIYPSSLTINQQNNFKQLIATNVQPVRLLFDIQLTNFTPTNEALNAELLSKGDFTLRMSEILPVTAFGPNFTTPTTYNPQTAY